MVTKSATQISKHDPLSAAQEAVAKGREAVQEAVAFGRDAAHDAATRGRTAVRQQIDTATKWASDQTTNKPLRTLGIAAAVGAVVALWLTRR